MKNAKRAFHWSGTLRKSALTSIWLKENVSVCVLIIPELFQLPQITCIAKSNKQKCTCHRNKRDGDFFHLVNTREWSFFGQWWGKTIDKTKEVKVFSKGVEPLALSYRTLVGVNVPAGHSKSVKNVRFVISVHSYFNLCVMKVFSFFFTFH